MLLTFAPALDGNPLQRLLREGKDRIQHDTQALMQRILDRYGLGVEVATIKLQDVDPPDQVADAFKDVINAQHTAGNLLISVIAGVTTYIFLLVVGVPFRGVLSLWVGFADLIPLVGATLGAIVVVGVAFLHSVPAGIAAVIFYILYQLFENHVLQVAVMSRTVKLNPLSVFIAVLVGVELFGILGALLAIPVAGIVQVIARDVWDERRGRFKPEPTIGPHEVPIGSAVQAGTPGPDGTGRGWLAGPAAVGSTWLLQ